MTHHDIRDSCIDTNKVLARTHEQWEQKDPANKRHTGQVAHMTGALHAPSHSKKMYQRSDGSSHSGGVSRNKRIWRSAMWLRTSAFGISPNIVILFLMMSD
jgi:hypothetical protein